MTERESEFDGRPELVKKRGRAILAQRIVMVVLGAYILASMTLLVVNALQGAQTRATLLDCTTPEGQCYKDGQKRTAKVVEELYTQGINRETVTRQIIVLAASCAGDEENTDAAAIEACVNERLVEANRVHLKDGEN